MAANYLIEPASGSNIYNFTEAVLKGLVLAEKAKVEFDETFIAVTGPNGNKFNIKGTFTYSLDTKGLPDTEFDKLLGGTVTSLTLIQNPGIVKYAIVNSFSIDVFAMLDLMLANDADALFAELGAMRFVGAEGGDVSRGSDADDLLLGHSGDDNLSGGNGNDEIEGGAGADILTGGAGIDTLVYKNSGGAVTVSLTGSAALGDAAGDIFSGFENLEGSSFGDKLTGNAGDNIISGGGGNDIINGGAGADTLEGGTDTDTASYLGSQSGVTVSLLTGVGTTGDAAGDTLIGFENLVGSNHDDKLTGNNAANFLDGGRGSDTLEGGLGTDTLQGRAGRDILVGGSGNDILIGGAGNDTFVLSDISTSTDTITAFVSGRDELRISAADFKGDLVAGQDLLPFQLEINATGNASSRDVRFVLNTTNGELTFDSNGSNSDNARVIAVLQSYTGLAITDFDIV